MVLYWRNLQFIHLPKHLQSFCWLICSQKNTRAFCNNRLIRRHSNWCDKYSTAPYRPTIMITMKKWKFQVFLVIMKNTLQLNQWQKMILWKCCKKARLWGMPWTKFVISKIWMYNNLLMPVSQSPTIGKMEKNKVRMINKISRGFIASILLKLTTFFKRNSTRFAMPYQLILTRWKIIQKSSAKQQALL